MFLKFWGAINFVSNELMLNLKSVSPSTPKPMGNVCT